MSVYIVFMESGVVHSVHKNRSKAEGEKARLDTMYEKATIKEFKVE